MKKYNITTQKSYEQNGEEKKYYPRVGSLTRFDATADRPEGFVLELNMYPNTKFYVFEQEPRKQQEETNKAFDEIPTNPF